MRRSKILAMCGATATALILVPTVAFGAEPGKTTLTRVSKGDPFAGCTVGGTPTSVLYPGAEVEPSVTTDRSRIIGVWQQDRWSDGGALGLVSAFSADGGDAFRSVPWPVSRCARGGLPYDRASDPWVDFGPDGTAYGSALVFDAATPRNGVPGNEFTMNVAEMTGAGRSTTDYWVRYSLSSMLFAGVFDRYPQLKVGSVEHETAWIPHWLQQMDFTYRERPVFTKGWKSREGLLPSDYWRRNMFVEFMEDELGVQMRDKIGVETMLWGSDFPHAESTWPRSQEFLHRIFAGTPKEVVRQITAENAARMFGFEVK